MDRSLIVRSLAENGVIGDDNRLIWRLKSDLRRFKEITLGKPMIMGRKTFESIGRTAARASHDRHDPRSGVFHARCRVSRALSTRHARAAEAIAQEMGASEVIVAGGTQIYEQALPVAQKSFG